MRAGETEWAHALAGGLFECGGEGSIVQCTIVPEAMPIGKMNDSIKSSQVKKTTRYDLDICGYCCSFIGSRVGLFPHRG